MILGNSPHLCVVVALAFEEVKIKSFNFLQSSQATYPTLKMKVFTKLHYFRDAVINSQIS